MDSTGTVDRDGSRIFILSTTSECGSLPLAIIITSSETCDLVSAGLLLLKEIMGDTIFYGNIEGPKIFMTDDSAVGRAAIESLWPKSTCLLSIFHVLQSVWRWLIKSKNGIKECDQQKLFIEFRNIMYASNETECQKAYEIASISSTRYPKYYPYLNEYWERRTLWALCYRNCLCREHNTNNISEAVMRLLQETIFERVKGFTLVQMIDFMLTKFVSFYERRLLDSADDRTKDNFVHYAITLPPPELIERIQCLSDTLRLVPSENNSSVSYIVNTEVLVCTCNQGRLRHICKHIYWICCLIESDDFIKKIDNEAIRKKFYFIATGNSDVYIQNKTVLSFSLSNCNSSNDITFTDEIDENVDEVCTQGNEIINDIKEEFSQYLNRSPVEVIEALKSFKANLKRIQTVAGFTSACYSFNKGKI